MTTHFSTVPIDEALRAARPSNPWSFRPLTLVADEDPMITDTLAAILDVVGLAVDIAPDGLAALETACVIPPEILIADLMMTRMTGLELARQVTRVAPDCGVILFVGNSAFPNLKATMRELGCNFRILFKPVHPAVLLGAVTELLGPRGQDLSIPCERHWIASDDPFGLRCDSEPLLPELPLPPNWFASETSAE
jgi:DNA-binding response OmpR family regulator